MKNKFFMMFLIIILTGCMTKNDEIVLKTNGGVPYLWKYTIDNKNIVKFKCKKVKVKDKNLAGGEVIEHYIFSGLEEGTTEIKFEYKNFTDNSVSETKKYKVIVDKNLKLKIKKIK